jgi:hypothetical protein
MTPSEQIKSSVPDEVRAKAKKSAERLKLGGKYGKLLGAVVLGSIGVATVIDVDRGMKRHRELKRAELVAKQQSRSKTKRYIPGLPGDPNLGLVQKAYDNRINHYRM